jgi:hypothetical protein
MKMKRIVKNGQIFEIVTSQKEAKEIIKDIVSDAVCNGEWLDDESSLEIRYKDGTEILFIEGFPLPKLRLTGIAAIHWKNPVTDCFYNGTIKRNEKYEDYIVVLNR